MTHKIVGFDGEAAFERARQVILRVEAMSRSRRPFQRRWPIGGSGSAAGVEVDRWGLANADWSPLGVLEVTIWGVSPTDPTVVEPTDVVETTRGDGMAGVAGTPVRVGRMDGLPNGWLYQSERLACGPAGTGSGT